MKLLIAGRTGTGKDTLQNILKNGYGWKPLLSYTTRARRPGEKDTHCFISKAEADAIPKNEKVTYAYFQNEAQESSEYFSTRKQVQESDCYIVDPDAIRILTKNMPEEEFLIVYLYTATTEQRRKGALSRAKWDKAVAEIFERRSASEDENFTRFEEEARDSFTFCGCNVIFFENTYDSKSIIELAQKLNTYVKEDYTS